MQTENLVIKHVVKGIYFWNPGFLVKVVHFSNEFSTHHLLVKKIKSLIDKENALFERNSISLFVVVVVVVFLIFLVLPLFLKAN